jgi:hypothetical protein
MTTFRLLTSVQNNPYSTWMGLLFAYSVFRHYGRGPIITVHDNGSAPFLPEFRLVTEKAGATVVRAVDLEHLRPPVRYCVWNQAASVLRASTLVEEDVVVFCDPDIIFLRPVDFAAVGAGPGVLTMDHLEFMNADHGVEHCRLAQATGKAAVSLERFRRRTWGGVPHVIHRQDAARTGAAWRDAIGMFASDDDIPWIAAMWALALAAERLGMRVATTRLCRTNDRDVTLSGQDEPIIHYCHGGRNFDKRRYTGPIDEARKVWDLRPTGDGTVDDRIRSEITEAARFYGIDDPDERRRILA